MKILFCGGGTFGHVAPALAAAEALKKKTKNAEIVFAGREGGKENDAVKRAGYPVYEIPMQSIERRLGLKSIESVFKMLRAFGEARHMLHELRPHIVFGTGGYVCLPFVRAAQVMGIPTVLHESNATPGRACRMLAPKCSKVLLGIRDCAGAMPRGTRCEFTGNPVRQDFFQYTKEKARRILGLPSEARLLLSFGGSGGAQCLNEAMLGFMTSKDARKKDLYHVHVMGRSYYEDAAGRYPTLTTRHSRSRIYPFIENMPLYMCGADLCVCRSGAMTLAELAAAGTPAILVPSPNVTDDHQYKNALSLAQNGGALLLEEKKIDQIGETILDTLEKEDLLSSMRHALLRHGEKNAADRIADAILSVLP
ncbi:MAG: undecaprenyldiphospho-muramoylpentapeptide beta-N-acetylglucosaminyltransferase [Clostridia bacterium]|nr:undecaprenyldiphospho-muramoylpentapeptide beta-N-acetylglucosaminyltransferase [Clostridia bacterium]